jgi:signal transduction histidine kinase
MEPDNYNSEKSENFPGDVTYNRKKNLIGSYAIIALTFLVLSLIFLTFNLRLLAGILVIAGASFVVLLTRKTGSLSESPKEPLAETPSPVGEKEKVISEFSHRIREPLNNLVLLADLLMDSGPQKRQKDLLETFVASTNNMVTIVKPAPCSREEHPLQYPFDHTKYNRSIQFKGRFQSRHRIYKERL